MSEFERLFTTSGLSLERLRTFLLVAEAGNLSKAAKGDVTRQSQFSRQVKELERYFGAPLTRRVGRRIEISAEGERLAHCIRRHFKELDDFRESMAERSVTVRIGSQGSVIDWLLLPRLGELRDALGGALVEFEQMRSADAVRGVGDGRLDFSVVREDAISKETKRWKLGAVGYAVFASKGLWKGCKTAEDLIGKVPVAELLPGGKFTDSWQQWLDGKRIVQDLFARVSSFTDLVRIVKSGQAAAVLPDLAAVDFDPKRFAAQPVGELPRRELVLIANARSLDRSGIPSGVAPKMAKLLKRG
jgi:DNA-binding transcriptional LysR family regulator